MLLSVLKYWDPKIEILKGLETNGASAMTGEKSGLVGRLKGTVTLVNITCASQRLHLVFIDVLNNPEFNKISNVDDILKQVT
jgi:hypothetical protein